MNRANWKYDFKSLFRSIIRLELIFWVLFLGGHFSIALIKKEPWDSAFSTYQYPQYFWFFALIPLIYFLYIGNLHWKNQVLGQFFSPNLQKLLLGIPSQKLSFVRFMVLRIGISFIIMAMANPQGQAKEIELDQNIAEMVVVVDISKSMLVEDLEGSVSRLEAAKNGLKDLARNMKGVSMSIIVFAGRAYVHMPMTRDLSSVSAYIDDISVDLVSIQGTNLAEALDLAGQSFSPKLKEKSLYVLTDGEDHQGGIEDVLPQLQQKGITIHFFALGSEQGGPIPLLGGGMKKDEKGEVIVSKPNFSLIEELAEAGKGSYAIIQTPYPSLVSIVNETLSSSKSKTIVQGSIRRSHGIVYGILGFILLLIYLILHHYKPYYQS